MSQIWALIVLDSTDILRVANSTPIVDFESMLTKVSDLLDLWKRYLNSFLVKRLSRLDFPRSQVRLIC